MSHFEKDITGTRELIEGTQEIVAKLNDIVATINDLLSKQNMGSENTNESQHSDNAAFEQDLRQLFQRYFDQGHSNDTHVLESQRLSLNSEKVSTPRPGKYRQRV